ncbi:MAG TPA: dCTP deaminase [Thermoanaerobaculia bacterium]|nr:dCTP deaminase [Thermoanaerobaculia bacterium]
MSQKSTLDEYSLEITARCQAGESRCRLLLGADFASDAPLHLAQALLNIFGYLARVATAMTASINWSGPEELIKKARRNLRVLDWQVKEFGAHIRYVESARTDRLPWQVIPSFEKLVGVLRPGAKVMLRPMWQYNYATIVSDLREVYLNELVEYEYYIPDTDVESHIVAPLGTAFHIISFPALERDNILLHSVIGHELGHLIASDLVERAKSAFLQHVQGEIEAATDAQLSAERLTEQDAPLWYQQYRTARLTNNSTICLKFWERAMEEVLADVVGAVLFGPAALFSTFEVAVQSGFDLSPSPRNEYYPPWRTRIREVLAVVDAIAGSILSPKPDLFLMNVPFALTDRAKVLGLDREARSRLVKERIQTIRDVASSSDDSAAVNYDPFAKIAYRALRSFVDDATKQIKSLLGKRAFNEKQVSTTLPALIERLDAGVTPNAEHDMPSRRLSKVSLVDVLNSAWFHKASLAVAPTNDGDRELLERVRGQRNRLTLKAVEYAFLADEYPVRPVREQPAPRSSTAVGVLTSDDIHEHMERKAVLDRLIVTPLFDASQSLVDSALDVRLGTEFVLFRKEAFDALDISEESLQSDVSRYQERVVRRIGERFVLHPRQLVIGSTLEYIQLPATVMAYVVGKSTWGRTGLVIATATKVDPGFRGCITLEIINEGEVPLVLLPGVPIAQLVFHRTERSAKYSGAYSCPIGPEFPRFASLVEGASFWMPKRAK